MFNSQFSNIQTARYIPAFLAVARTGSFTKAANTLRISQPAVTMAIHHLETILNVRLFERSTRRVSLTRHGERFVAAAERLVASLDIALADISLGSASDATQIRITAVHSVAEKILPAALLTLVSSRPDVRIILHDGTSRGVWRRVKSNESDFGIASASSDEPLLSFTPLFRDRLCVLARADQSFFGDRAEIAWSDLADLQCVRVVGDFPAALLANEPAIPENIKAPPYEISYSTLLWAILNEGGRFSIVPALFAPNRELSGLDFRPLCGPVMWRTAYAVTPRNKPLDPVLESILGLIRDVVNNVAADDSLIEPLS